MKTSIVCISILTLLCFCSSALCQKAASPQNAVKSSAVKTNQTQAAKPAASAAKVQAAKTPAVNKPVVSAQQKSIKVVQLDKEIDLSSLSSRTTFEQAIDILRNSTKPQTQIVVMWRQLEQAGIEPTSPIGIDGISKTTIGTALKTILNSITDKSSQVDFWAEERMIVIGSRQSTNASKTTNLYNMQDITSAPAGTTGFGGAGNIGMAGGLVNQIQMASVGIGYGGGGYGGGGYGMGGYGMGGMGGYGMSGMGGMGGGGMGGYGMGGMGGYGMGSMGGMGGYGMGGMGGGGIGFGGMGGMNTMQQQQQLKGLIRRTIKPGTWNP